MKKAFTLFELIVVIAILSIISVILIPKYLKIKKEKEEQIVEIANEETKVIYIFDGHEITEEEAKKYEIDYYEQIDNIIFVYYIVKY